MAWRCLGGVRGGELATEVLAAVGKTTRGRTGLGPGEELVGPEVSGFGPGFLYSFPLFSVADFPFSVICFALNKIAEHFIKYSKHLLGVRIYIASHSQDLEIFEIQII